MMLQHNVEPKTTLKFNCLDGLQSGKRVDSGPLPEMTLCLKALAVPIS